MEVYVLTQTNYWEYEDSLTHVIGVYSSYEKAREVERGCTKASGYDRATWDIEVFKIDE